MNAPVKLGKMVLNRNPLNYFSETESVSFAPSNVVDGVSFVPDALLQWRLMSYDDTATHRHNSPNGFLLPVNAPIAPVNNNYRDGYMQSNIFEGESASSPNGIGGVMAASPQEALAVANENLSGQVGRFQPFNDPITQARGFWFSMDQYAQQHTVDAYRFELGHVSNPNVTAKYISTILNPVNNCLARRVAFGVGAPMPAIGTGSSVVPNTTFPSIYPLATNVSIPVTGLMVAILTTSDDIPMATYKTLTSALSSDKALFEVVASHQGVLASGVPSNESYVTTSSVLFDAVVIVSGGFSANTSIPMVQQEFVREAFGHGKPIGEGGSGFLSSLQLTGMGLFMSSDAGSVMSSVIGSMEMPGRYPQRNPLDDVKAICG